MSSIELELEKNKKKLAELTQQNEELLVQIADSRHSQQINAEELYKNSIGNYQINEDTNNSNVQDFCLLGCFYLESIRCIVS
jgi:hypothetical protein